MGNKSACRPVLGPAAALLFLTATSLASAQPWTSFENNTRYVALGDSLSAGFEAKPVTRWRFR